MSSVTVQEHRYLIIGAGAAGLQLGYYLQQAGCDYLTLEREHQVGAFFKHFPRHRRLISLNKVHNDTSDPEIRLRWDWNSLLSDSPELVFPKYSTDYFPHADDMVRYLEDFRRAHRLAVRFGVEIERIRLVGEKFHVQSADGRVFVCTCLIMATGWGQPHVPDIAGIELATGYEDMPTSPELFRGKRVLILGKGNSAFETANRLLEHAAMVHLASPRPLRLAWNTKHPGDVRGQYGTLLDSYQFKTLHSVLDCVVEQIWWQGDRFHVLITYTHAEGEQEILEYDAVLRCTGFRMNTTLFDGSCTPEMAANGRIPATTPDWQSVNVDAMYFAGTLAQARDFKQASSAFIDGFRYNLRTLSRLLMERWEGVPLDREIMSADPGVLTQKVLDRVNWSSALWTQFEYFCDALVLDEQSGRMSYYQDLPEDYAVTRFAAEGHLFTVALRWGRQDYRDVFAIERHPRPERAAESAFIHPVIRRYRFGELIAEQHLLEDLLAHWRRPDRHVEPLRNFLTDQLRTSVPPASGRSDSPRRR
jgi:thioredoxin reductase